MCCLLRKHSSLSVWHFQSEIYNTLNYFLVTECVSSLGYPCSLSCFVYLFNFLDLIPDDLIQPEQRLYSYILVFLLTLAELFFFLCLAYFSVTRPYTLVFCILLPSFCVSWCTVFSCSCTMDRHKKCIKGSASL